MKTEIKTKDFDAVKMMREIRDNVSLISDGDFKSFSNIGLDLFLFSSIAWAIKYLFYN